MELDLWIAPEVLFLFARFVAGGAASQNIHMSFSAARLRVTPPA